MLRKYYWILYALIVVIPACQEDELLPYSLNGTYNCFQDQTWTVMTVDEAIVGSWEWVYFSCFNGEVGKTEAGELMLTLKGDHTLEVYRNGLLERTDSWQVIPRGNENFELQTTTNLLWLNGDIVVCDDLLLFFESYIDGCDNYFERL